MEIRVLRYFLTIAREGSITRAANTLHVTQPTLSRQIKALEDELGQKLFTRSNHNVTLTPEGMFLRKRAEEIVELVDKTEADFNSLKGTVSGEIYIGGGETDAMKLIAGIVKEMQEDYQDIHYHLFSGNAEDVTERLDKGLLDFGILMQPVDLKKYDYVEMPVKDVWGVVMRNDSPLADKKEIKRSDLLNIPLICSRQAIHNANMPNEFINWFGKDFDKLNIITTFNLVYNAAVMVEAGIGYVITFDRLVNTMHNQLLCFRPLYPRLEAGLYIVWKKNLIFFPAAQLFFERIRKMFGAE